MFVNLSFAICVKILMFNPFVMRGCLAFDCRTVLVDLNHKSFGGSSSVKLKVFINVNILTVGGFYNAIKGAEN